MPTNGFNGKYWSLDENVRSKQPTVRYLPDNDLLYRSQNLNLLLPYRFKAREARRSNPKIHGINRDGGVDRRLKINKHLHISECYMCMNACTTKSPCKLLFFTFNIAWDKRYILFFPVILNLLLEFINFLISTSASIGKLVSLEIFISDSLNKLNKFFAQNN